MEYLGKLECKRGTLVQEHVQECAYACLDSELTYEKKHEFNIGSELGFLNNRINVTFDLFWRNNFDLIGPIATQGIGGQVVR